MIKARAIAFVPLWFLLARNLNIPKIRFPTDKRKSFTPYTTIYGFIKIKNYIVFFKQIVPGKYSKFKNCRIFEPNLIHPARRILKFYMS